jgi:hypothetical protein
MYNHYAVIPIPSGLKHEDVWWRCEFNNNEKPIFLSLKVIKTTPKGVRLQRNVYDSVHILGKSRRQYAAPTKELALHDALCRKQVHARILQSRLENAVTKAEKLQELYNQFTSGEQRI